jgi:3-oxoacyl-[acyl-carrier-protein] synthase-3
MTSTYSRISSSGSAFFEGDTADGTDAQMTVGMAESASRQALDDAGLAAADIDFLVLATTSPDIVFPNGGCLLQERLGLRGCAAFSVEAGSTGFVYALSIADRFIATGQATRALIIGADTLAGRSGAADRKSSATSVAAAGALILEAASEPGILSSNLGGDRGNPHAPTDSTRRQPADIRENNMLGVQDAESFASTVESLCAAFHENLARNKLAGGDIDCFIPQQTDETVIQMLSHGLDIPMRKMAVVPENLGDRATAVIPLAFDHAIRTDRIGDGDLVALAALGSEGTWGTALIRC